MPKIPALFLISNSQARRIEESFRQMIWRETGSRQWDIWAQVLLRGIERFKMVVQ